MSADTDRGTAILEQFKLEIIRLFNARPPHGSVSFTVHFTDGEARRFEYAASVGQLVKPDRGQR